MAFDGAPEIISMTIKSDGTQGLRRNLLIIQHAIVGYQVRVEWHTSKNLREHIQALRPKLRYISWTTGVAYEVVVLIDRDHTA